MAVASALRQGAVVFARLWAARSAIVAKRDCEATIALLWLVFDKVEAYKKLCQIFWSSVCILSNLVISRRVASCRMKLREIERRERGGGQSSDRCAGGEVGSIVRVLDNVVL